jgi:hypothetical protein
MWLLLVLLLLVSLPMLLSMCLLLVIPVLFMRGINVGTIGHTPHARGGVFSYVVTIFFYLPMPARKFSISWHITIFAVHGF